MNRIDIFVIILFHAFACSHQIFGDDRQIFSPIVSLFAHQSAALIWLFFILIWIFSLTILDPWDFGIVPSAPTIMGIASIFVLYSFYR